MPKSSNRTATESPTATVATADTVDVASPSTPTDASAIVADGAEPRPSATEAVNSQQAGTRRVDRRNKRGTTAAAVRSLTADGPDVPAAASSADPDAIAASDRANGIGGNAGSAVPDRVWNALLAHPGAT